MTEACLVHDWGQPVKAVVVLAAVLVMLAVFDQRRRNEGR